MILLKLRQLDRKLSPVHPLFVSLAVPPKGWIATIRETLGMTTHQLGQRMGLSQQRVSMLERSEVNHSTTVKSLEKAAESLGCRLFYCFVPNEPLEQMVSNQALEKASRTIAHISHTMQLEGQGVEGHTLQQQTRSLAYSWLKNPKNLWADE